MPTREIILIVSIAAFLASGILLITGSAILTLPLISNPYVPWGTLITWVGLVSLPLCLYLGFKGIYQPTGKKYKLISGVVKMLVVLSFLWVPVSYLLAGNLSFSFTETPGFQGGQIAMRMFWIFSGALVVLPLLSFTLFGLFTLSDYFQRFRKKS